MADALHRLGDGDSCSALTVRSSPRNVNHPVCDLRVPGLQTGLRKCARYLGNNVLVRSSHRPDHVTAADDSEEHVAADHRPTLPTVSYTHLTLTTNREV